MAKVIMIQGTMSSAGKTFLTAGLCRIFKQDGYSVAPFKAQNMALNSFVTNEGLEMGRAQVVEAEAAGVRPEIAMNPILLKPNSDTGSQLIVNGEARGDYTAEEYYELKKELMPAVLEAFNDLAKRFDIVVIEGAGSPAEINLRDDDLVNMGLAEAVDAPVVLVGDIDRGGVFAQLYGTVALMTDEERARVKAFVINKFRGDVDILTPGFDLLYDKVPIPVVGVIPYTDIDLDDEDSLSERLTEKKEKFNDGKAVPVSRCEADDRGSMLKISVIRFPRISNFTDFNALERLPGVDLEYVSKPEELYGSDMIILPGTKSTMSDLEWLRESGFEPVIVRAAEKGIPVFGICGGFQMLGEALSDPYGVESGKDGEKMAPESTNNIGSVEESQDSNSIPGIGLLPVNTVFAREKTRTRVRGLADGFNNVPIEGYEIHMGETSITGGRNFSILRETSAEGKKTGTRDRKSSEAGYSASVKTDGCVNGNVYGTYVHGIFDSPEMQKEIVRRLSENKVFYGLRFEPEDECAETVGTVTGSESNEQGSRERAPGKRNESRDPAKSACLEDPAKYKEEQYDRMADVVRESLDMDLIYDILDGRL